MGEWKNQFLGDIADVIDSLHKTPRYSVSGYPMVRVTDIKPGYLKLDDCLRVDEATYKEFTQRRRPQIGDIVFSRVGSYGVSAIVNSSDPFCLGQNTTFIVPKQDPFYLYYFLNSSDALSQIEGLVAGSTQPTISLKSIKEIVVPTPSLPEQAAIAEVLSSLDDKIDLLHRQNKTLESLAETLFRQWFIEEADSIWEKGNIYNLVNVVYGYPFKSTFFNEEYRGLPLIRIRDLKDGFSDTFTDEECDPKYLIDTGDLIAGMDGEFRLHVWSGTKSVLNQRLCKFEPKYNYVPKLFVYNLIKPHLHFYENTKVGTTVIHLGKSDIDDIEISIPPRQKLREFGNVTDPIFAKLKINFEQLRTLTSLRNSLLPKLISGGATVGE